MAPRWKGKGEEGKKRAEAEALANPVSKIVSQLQSTLVESNSQGLLSSCSVLLEAEEKQTHLLKRACFGRPIITAQKNDSKQCFELSLEEAFYLNYCLRCIKIFDEKATEKSCEELWNHMKLHKVNFPDIFIAYSHLRKKNWVVLSGSQYGVDFVAYRHHPELVHSEFAVLVLSGDDENANLRLRTWSDFHCTLRLCSSVAKTLLVLYVKKRTGEKPRDSTSISCLNDYDVEERTITRWNPEQCREQKHDETEKTTSS